MMSARKKRRRLPLWAKVTITGVIIIIVCGVLTLCIVNEPNGPTQTQPYTPMPGITTPTQTSQPPTSTPSPTRTPSPTPTRRPHAPSSSVPPSSVPPQARVGPGKPERMIIHRDQTVIVPLMMIGEMGMLPDGRYSSPGSGLSWINTSSPVGTGMEGSAIIFGMGGGQRLDALANVQPGDMIEVDVAGLEPRGAPLGTVTFVVDTVKVSNGDTVVSHEPGTLQVALCACGGRAAGVVISAHIAGAS